MSTTIGRLRLAVSLVLGVFVVGTVGFSLFGLDFVDAMYMTVITITTVGYREVGDIEYTNGYKLFTMAIAITGVSTGLYTFTLGIQTVVEGQIRAFLGRKRMDKHIAQLENHIVLCGWGRVGKTVAQDLARFDKEVVVVDLSAERLAEVPHLTVMGDATLDATLLSAGIERADALIAALEGDAENLFVTLSARAINPGLFIVARAREEESVPKLSRAGANRVVNPQELGAARMASFVVHPNVAEFVDVVMHERSMDFRMSEVVIAPNSPLAGQTLRQANLRQYAAVLVLALRDDTGHFTTNPDPDVELHAGNIVIVVGTNEALEQLTTVVT